MTHLQFAADLARSAGQILRYYSSRDKQIEFKGRANPVTVADRESEALIISEIRRSFPDHAVLAEESGANAQISPWKWIIDPLDGTTNFAHQFPFYCVSIGLEHDGVVQCGAVYDPIRDELFTGSRGGGAFVNGVPLRVSETAELSSALLVTGFPYGFREKIELAMRLFQSFMMESQAIRRAGSAALDICYLAAGRCDGFWELDLSPWDTAAASVIAEEAGARFTDFRGGRYSIYLKEILGSNGAIHDQMKRVCERVRT